MLNQQEFSNNGAGAVQKLIPGKLEIDTDLFTFYKQKYKIKCYSSTVATENTITISNICDNSLGRPSYSIGDSEIHSVEKLSNT